jgi:hypothetical protein
MCKLDKEDKKRGGVKMKKNILFTVMLLEVITLPAYSKKEAVVNESAIKSSNNKGKKVVNPLPSSPSNYIPTNVSVSQGKPSAPLTYCA